MPAQIVKQHPRPRVSPRDFFVHLLSMGMLYAVVAWFLTLLYQYINMFVPDASALYLGQQANQELIRIALAVLIIVFPAYIASVWFLSREYNAHPEKRHLWIRRWLSYFTLFASAIAIIVSLITLVYNLLSGEIAARFIFKICAVLLTSSAVFAYYFWDLRRHNADE